MGEQTETDAMLEEEIDRLLFQLGCRPPPLLPPTPKQTAAARALCMDMQPGELDALADAGHPIAADVRHIRRVALVARVFKDHPPKMVPEPELTSTLLGLPSQMVEPRSACVLATRPQLPARLRSILVDYATAEAFSLGGIKVGKMEVSAIANEPVPLSMMGVEVEGWPRAMEIGGQQKGGLDLWKGRWAVVNVGQCVSVMVENTSDRAVQFRGVLRVEILDENHAANGARL